MSGAFLAPSSSLAAVRSIVQIGQVNTPFVRWSVENNSYYQADTFEVKLPLVPPGADMASEIAYWGSIAPPLLVNIFVGTPPNPSQFTASDLTSLLQGAVDEIYIEPLTNTVQLYGRDLTSGLIDTKTSEKFIGQTSSDIAEKLAARHGLSASIVPTKTPTGVYYNNDHVNLHDDRTEWDLLTYLADREGYQVYVQGQTLYFQPTQQNSLLYPLILTPSTATTPVISNCTKLEIVRNLTLARDIVVNVRSWLPAHKSAFVKTATRTKQKTTVAAPSIGYAPKQVFTYTIPNLQPNDAQQRAEAIADQISAHEMNIVAEMPGDSVLSINSLVTLNNTGSVLDQAYYPNAIKRTFSFKQGFMQTLYAKNHQVESEVVA